MEAQATAAVKEALAALYHHPDDATRTAADRWLQQFQHTLDAWQVADSLLHDESSNMETQIFCSQTLRSKVQRDFEELPSEAFRPLQDSLYALLKKFSKGPQTVRTQICIAMSALAVHVPVEDWGGGGIVNWLSDEMNSQQDFIPSFLELLTVLPQDGPTPAAVEVQPEVDAVAPPLANGTATAAVQPAAELDMMLQEELNVVEHAAVPPEEEEVYNPPLEEVEGGAVEEEQ